MVRKGEDSLEKMDSISCLPFGRDVVKSIRCRGKVMEKGQEDIIVVDDAIFVDVVAASC